MSAIKLNTSNILHFDLKYVFVSNNYSKTRVYSQERTEKEYRELLKSIPKFKGSAVFFAKGRSGELRIVDVVRSAFNLQDAVKERVKNDIEFGKISLRDFLIRELRTGYTKKIELYLGSF